MKRLFSILISSLFFATSMWAVSVNDINSYATRLRLVGNGAIADDGTVGIRFYVMAPTKGVWVYVDLNKNDKFDANEAVFSDANRTIAKNNYDTIYLKIPDTTRVGEYRWAVKVKGLRIIVGGVRLKLPEIMRIVIIDIVSLRQWV